MGRVRVRAVLYARVSHDPDGNGRSVSEQLTEGHKVIDRNDWECVAVYQDNNASASKYGNDARPEWAKLEADLYAGKFDVLVVWEPSRATRDRSAWAALAYACEVRNVKICVSGKVYDLSDPDDAFTLDIFYASAYRESAQTRKRVQRTMTATAQKGRPGPGKAPYGYRRVYDMATGTVIAFEPDEKIRQAELIDGDAVTVTTYNPAGIVRNMFADILTGVTAYSIARELNAKGIPNPRTLNAIENHPERERKYSPHWDPNMIRRMLANKAYLGQRQHRGKTMAENTWTALVEPETFYAVANEQVRRRRRFLGTEGRMRPALARHLLTRIAICNHCDRGMQSTTSGGKPGYRCRFGSSFIVEPHLDHYVVSYVLDWLTTESNLTQLQGDAEIASEVATARGEVERLTAELAKAKEMMNADLIDLDDYANRRAKLLPQIEAAEHRARTSGLPSVLRGVAGPDAALTWRRLELTAQRDIIRALVEIRVKPAGRGNKGIPIEDRVVLTKLLGAGAGE